MRTYKEIVKNYILIYIKILIFYENPVAKILKNMYFCKLDS